MKYEFGRFGLDTERRELSCENKVVHIEPQVFDLLCVLIENRDRVVTKDELMALVWNGRIVSDSSLSGRISDLRLALGDDGRSQNIIRTIHSRGFQFVASLREIETHDNTTAVNAINSAHAIAVLPLSTLSADIEQQFLADGIAIDIIEALTAWRGFPVVAWSAVQKFRGAIDQARIAGELGVRYIVSGSLRMAGERIRVTLQLTEAETWYVVWSQTYERSARDVFEVQDDVAARVAATIAPHLEWVEGKKSLQKRQSDLQFWEYFHRGNAHLLEFTEKGNEAARQVFKAALGIDSESGKAWTGVAYSLDRDLFWGFSRDRSKHIQEMFEATTEAVKADPNYNLGKIMHAYSAIWVRDFKLALASAREALVLNPSDGFSHIILGEVLDILGEREEAVERARAGVALNENHPRIHTFRGVLLRIYLSARNYAAAEDWGVQALHERSDYPHLHAYIATSLVYQGRDDEARDLMRRVPRVPVGLGQSYKDKNDNAHIAKALKSIGWEVDSGNPGVWIQKS